MEGFPDPEGQNLRWIKRGILGGGVNLFNVGEVARPIMLAVPRDTSIVELFDPFGGDVGPFSEGDGECGKPIVSDIPIRSLDEGLLIVKEPGLGELETFFELVNRCLVFRSLGPCLAEILLMTAVRSLDECIDNGAERGWVQVGGCDGVSNRLGRQSPQWDVELDRHVRGPRVGGVACAELPGYASGGVVLVSGDGDGGGLAE